MARRSPPARRQEEQVSTLDGFTPVSTADDALAAELEAHLPNGWSVSELTYSPEPSESDTSTYSVTLTHDHAPVSIEIEPASTARAQCAIRPQNTHRVVFVAPDETIEKVGPEKMFDREDPAEVFEPVVAVATAALNRHGLWFYSED